MARRKVARIGILSRKRSLYSTRRLVEAARRAGVKSIVMDTLRCELMLSPRPRMLYRGAEVKGLSVGIPRGRDVRALVIGDQVVGAMRRTARKGEFRSNLHRGGEGKPLPLPKNYAQAAAKAARIIGLDVAGVDMLEGKEGPKVMELNSSP